MLHAPAGRHTSAFAFRKKAGRISEMTPRMFEALQAKLRPDIW